MTGMYAKETTVIHPSILNADFMKIGKELERISNADAVHVDVMDNHFVPNLTFGPSMVEQIVKRSPIAVDAHLMIDSPDTDAVQYAEAGARSVTFHLEASAAPIRLARELRKKNVAVGIGIRPATAIEPLLDVIGEFDLLLIMTVEPGFGGQAFLESMLPKIRRARKAISESHLDVSVQVDGGISANTIARAAEAGANVFVAGSAVYQAQDAAKEIETLRNLASKHRH